MAFTILETGKPPYETLLHTREQLSYMTDGQFMDEVSFWQDIRSRGGSVAQEIATRMLRQVMTPVDLVRQAHKVSDVMSPDMAKDLASLTGGSLAGLALSQFLRRTISGGLTQMRSGTGGIGVDVVFGPGQSVALVHERLDNLDRFVPPLRQDVKFTWYEDEVLIVRGHTPATPTMEFRERFLGTADGFFDDEAYATLRPQLKAAYVGL